jgi:hypothetical protein
MSDEPIPPPIQSKEPQHQPPHKIKESAVSADDTRKTDAARKPSKSGKWLKRSMIAIVLLLAAGAAGYYFVFKDRVMLLVEISSDKEGRGTKFEYDAHNRIIRVNDAELIYDRSGDLISAGRTVFKKNGNFITYPFSHDGFVEEEIELDARGFPVRRDHMYFLDHSVFVTTIYRYQNDNMISAARTHSNNPNTFTYDDKKSPFYYCETPRWYLEMFGGNYGFKNNILTEDCCGDVRLSTYTYTYDDNGFPLTRKVTNRHREQGEWEEWTEMFTYKRVSNWRKKVDNMAQSALVLVGLAAKKEPAPPTPSTDEPVHSPPSLETKPTDGTVAAAPTNVTASSASSSSIKISWSAVPEATGYRVYSRKADGDFTRVGADLTKTSFTHTGLSANTTYHYRVSATNDAGESRESSIVSASTTAPAPATASAQVPAPARQQPLPEEKQPGINVAASASSSGHITIRWNPIPGATGYQVFRSTTYGGAYTYVGTVTSTSFMDTGLPPNATYFYSIRPR